MSRRPAFTDSALLAAIGPKPPSGFSREDRIRLLGTFFDDVLAGRTPDRAAALFVCGAGASWLREGGDLVRDYFRIVRPKSHETPQRVWTRISAHTNEREADGDAL